MRRFAISDIHGCAKTFKALLQKIEFSKKDILYLLGDYIDRGPDSRGVIDHIWKLQEEGFQVHCLMGNHEEMLLDEIRGRRTWYNGESATLNSFGVNFNKDIPRPYIKWMEELNYFIALPDYILVHAGLNFKIRFPLTDKREMLWIRNWYDSIDKEWLGQRIIVHGHTPTPKKIINILGKAIDASQVINIDTGCVYKKSDLGNLCAFNLENKELIFQENVEDFIEV